MPRKQRFKPSRKPKAVGTLTDLAPMDGAGPAVPNIEPANAREGRQGGGDPEAIGRADAISSAPDLGGESG
jgi:hypothetical protein